MINFHPVEMIAKNHLFSCAFFHSFKDFVVLPNCTKEIFLYQWTPRRGRPYVLFSYWTHTQ